MNQETYRNIMSGQGSGFRTTLPRLFLVALSWPYSVIVRIRNALYSAGWLRASHAGVPVISVGNLTAGGTGKTPLVAWLARLLDERGKKTVILTRGYKTERDAPSDEPAELASTCPGVPVVINPDRVAGAAEAVRKHGAEVLLLDDGFQHRRLARDLDIVTIDATLPFGYGRQLPAGLLREPVGGLRRAHAVVLTRCDLVPESRLREIEETIRRINDKLAVARSIHAPARVEFADERPIDPQTLQSKRILAFCGIGNPPEFFDTLRHLGCTLTGTSAFDDHYRYTDACLGQIHKKAVESGAQLILTTQKDWTKVACLDWPQEGPPCAYLTIELQLGVGAAEVTTLIDRVLSGKMLCL